MIEKRRLETISQVIEELDLITAQCYDCKDSLGVFSAVYRRTTKAVMDAIENGRFQDAERMKKLDIEFAILYLDAYQAYRKGQPIALSWKVAFDAASARHLTLMQHLLLGMNAHIMLDLSVAAARVCPGEEIHSLKQDFMMVNDVLKELIDEIQDGIGRHSPVWRLLDIVGWRMDEKLVCTGIRRARQQAWENAVELAGLPPHLFGQSVKDLDARVAKGASRVIDVMLPKKPLQWLISITERNPIKAIPTLQNK
jgi:hypothetical protein